MFTSEVCCCWWMVTMNGFASFKCNGGSNSKTKKKQTLLWDLWWNVFFQDVVSTWKNLNRKKVFTVIKSSFKRGSKRVPSFYFSPCSFPYKLPYCVCHLSLWKQTNGRLECFGALLSALIRAFLSSVFYEMSLFVRVCLFCLSAARRCKQVSWGWSHISKKITVEKLWGFLKKKHVSEVPLYNFISSAAYFFNDLIPVSTSWTMHLMFHYFCGDCVFVHWHKRKLHNMLILSLTGVNNHKLTAAHLIIQIQQIYRFMTFLLCHQDGWSLGAVTDKQSLLAVLNNGLRVGFRSITLQNDAQGI